MKRGADMGKTAAYCTLGCKVNQYDTDAMRELLEQAGYRTVDFSQSADVYLVNTCTVTNIADRKSRQMIRRAVRQNPAAVVCVCGCLAQNEAEELLRMEGVRAVVGAQNRAHIVQIVADALAGGPAVNAVDDIACERVYEPLAVHTSSDKTRAHIKICEGCDNFCSYCIIPYARGRVRSRPLEDVLAEARVLAEAGVREVVLTGIHLGSYGKDLQGVSLIDVIEALGRVPKLARIRLGSLEPSLLTPEFCRHAAAVQTLCPHFHVSLQSGSTGVLERMRRRYTPEEYAAYIANLREVFDRPAITTDVIAGFPQETEQEHAETMAFLRHIGFAKVHVFPYSRRAGTAAAKMSGQVPGETKRQRAAELAQLAREMEEEYARAFVGSVQRVLFEESLPGGLCEGHTARYVIVRAPGTPNELRDVQIKAAEGSTLIGI